MRLRPFVLHEVHTVSEAVSLMAELGEEAAFYAGGTELILAMKKGVLRYKHLVDIKRIPELYGITWHEDRQAIRIGACVTHSELERSILLAEKIPEFCQLEREVANVRVRHAGTLGGNLCFADPHSDPGTFLVALGATLELAGPHGRRRIPAEEFFLGEYETARAPGELLVSVEIPWPGPHAALAYQKFQHLERPAVGVAAILWADPDGNIGQARVAVGCVHPRFARLRECEEMLRGRHPREVLDGLAASCGQAARDLVDPVDDLNGSAEYKRHLTAVMVRRTLEEAARKLQEKVRTPHVA